MKFYDLYLFDFDYTLADSSRGIVMCFRHVLEKHGYAGISDNAIKQTIGRTLEDSFSVLTGVTEMQTLLDYRTQYVEKADVCMTDNTFLFPETIEVLTALKERGAKVGIISTKQRYCIMELMDQKVAPGFLDIVIGDEDVKTPKPSPEGLLTAIGKLNGSRQNTLYIGDSMIDAQTAQAAGVDFVGVTHGATTYEELAGYPHVEIAKDLSVLV